MFNLSIKFSPHHFLYRSFPPYKCKASNPLFPPSQLLVSYLHLLPPGHFQFIPLALLPYLNPVKTYDGIYVNQVFSIVVLFPSSFPFPCCPLFLPFYHSPSLPSPASSTDTIPLSLFLFPSPFLSFLSSFSLLFFHHLAFLPSSHNSQAMGIT